MDQVIHITLNGTDFDIPKDILLESDFFRGMLDIEENNLVIDNPEISVDILKTLLMMVSDENGLTKELAKLYDMLGFDNRYKTIKYYYCTIGGCTKICKIGKICNIHKCTKETCVERKWKNLYCKRHTCIIANCNNQTYENEYYCCVHIKCTVENCIKHIKRDKHGPFIASYCYIHACIAEYCYDIKYSNSNYCFQHLCIVDECKDIRVDKYFCSLHQICSEKNCGTSRGWCRMYSNGDCPNTNVIGYCSIHECRMDRCTNHISNIDGSLCEQHLNEYISLTKN